MVYAFRHGDAVVVRTSKEHAAARLKALSVHPASFLCAEEGDHWSDIRGLWPMRPQRGVARNRVPQMRSCVTYGAAEIGADRPRRDGIHPCGFVEIAMVSM